MGLDKKHKMLSYFAQVLRSAIFVSALGVGALAPIVIDIDRIVNDLL